MLKKLNGIISNQKLADRVLYWVGALVLAALLLGLRSMGDQINESHDQSAIKLLDRRADAFIHINS